MRRVTFVLLVLLMIGCTGSKQDDTTVKQQPAPPTIDTLLHTQLQLEETYTLQFLQRLEDQYRLSTHLILNSNNDTISTPSWKEETGYSDPIIQDIDNDGKKDVILEESNESYKWLYLYLQRGRTLALALETTPYDIEPIDPELQTVVKSGYSFVDLTGDDIPELVMENVLFPEDGTLHQQIVFALEDSKYVRITD